jgi:hypothetical protein
MPGSNQGVQSALIRQTSHTAAAAEHSACQAESAPALDGDDARPLSCSIADRPRARRPRFTESLKLQASLRWQNPCSILSINHRLIFWEALCGARQLRLCSARHV